MHGQWFCVRFCDGIYLIASHLFSQVCCMCNLLKSLAWHFIYMYQLLGSSQVGTSKRLLLISLLETRREWYLLSVPKWPLQPGHVRAYIHSGGYIVTPLKSGPSRKPRTLVEVVLEMDVAGWSSLCGTWFCSYPVHLRNSLLSVVAGASLFFL
jgi:hypothetical protein